MKNSRLNHNNKFFLSIILGITTAAGTFIILILFFFATGLFGWSDGGDPKYLKRIETTTYITAMFSIIAALFAGIYVIVKMNKPKQKGIDSFLSDRLLRQSLLSHQNPLYLKHK